MSIETANLAKKIALPIIKSFLYENDLLDIELWANADIGDVEKSEIWFLDPANNFLCNLIVSEKWARTPALVRHHLTSLAENVIYHRESGKEFVKQDLAADGKVKIEII